MSKELRNPLIEDNDEFSLRPKYLKEYIGQKELKENLEVFIGAARKRDETLDHVLLYGPPGLGKTTLAHIIANEMRANIKLINGPSIEKTGDLAAILSTLEAGDILFIDEIHRLPKVVEEVLYGAMEDFCLSIIISKESGASSLNITLPPFTLVGATTQIGNLSSPLRARFGIKEKLEYYLVSDLANIITRTAKVFNSKIDNNAAIEIAKRSRGTPRIANNLFKRIRDFVNYKDTNIITYSDTIRGLKALRVDSLGLEDVHINYLKAIYFRFKGGPVGVETIAFSIGEEKNNLEEVCEPYLLKLNFIDRTPRGRIITKLGIDHLKKVQKE